MKTPKTSSNGHATPDHRHPFTSRATARNLLAVLFRRRWQVLLSFAGIFAVVAVISLFGGNRYVSRMMILVSQNERANTPVNGQPNAQPIRNPNGVTVEQMNSEVALLRSQDLLRQVVLDCGLNAKPASYWRKLPLLHSRLSPDQKTAEAVRTLADKLKIEILPMSNMIRVSYPSPNPALGARVLKTLAALYMQKHVAVHRPQGVYAFFQQQAKRYQEQLANQESRLVDYTQQEGVVSAPEEMTAALQRVSQLESMQDDTHANTIGTEQRIRELEKELGAMAPRVTTSIKTSDNAQLIQNLRSTLLDLELKRTDLLQKYQPSYRPVREVEKQIADTRAAIATAEKAPWREVTTNRDPTFESTLAELTKARADLADDAARTVALGQAVGNLKSRATWLQQQGVVQQNMMRKFKTAETDYLLYLNKAEQARIDDALDSRRILNVALAEAPSAPALPTHSTLWYLALSAFVAGLAAIGLAFATDKLDPTVRTPDEVEVLLNLPLLGVLPDEMNPYAMNGHTNGHSNGNGNGYHNGHSNGNGNGHVHVHGNGNGYHNGHSNGNGNGHSNGNGNGNGHGRIETHVP